MKNVSTIAALNSVATVGTKQQKGNQAAKKKQQAARSVGGLLHGVERVIQSAFRAIEVEFHETAVPN